MVDQYVWSIAYVNDMVLRDEDADDSSSTGNLGKTSSGLEQRLYAQTDANYNVTALIDTSGAVVERYIYDPYGTVSILNVDGTSRGTSSYGWGYLYQGGRLESGTDLYAFGARDYDAGVGRWIERDPTGYPDGMDQYAFDPTGLDPTGCNSWEGQGWSDYVSVLAPQRLLILGGTAVLHKIDDFASARGWDTVHSVAQTGIGIARGVRGLCDSVDPTGIKQVMGGAAAVNEYSALKQRVGAADAATLTVGRAIPIVNIPIHLTEAWDRRSLLGTTFGHQFDTADTAQAWTVVAIDVGTAALMTRGATAAVRRGMAPVGLPVGQLSKAQLWKLGRFGYSEAEASQLSMEQLRRLQAAAPEEVGVQMNEAGDIVLD